MNTVINQKLEALRAQLDSDKTALGEGDFRMKPSVKPSDRQRHWEREMENAHEALRDAHFALARSKKRMEARATDPDLLRKFGSAMDKALGGIEAALNDFTY